MKTCSASGFEDIAEYFERRSSEAQSYADRTPTIREASKHLIEARVWREAAAMLRDREIRLSAQAAKED